MKKRAAFFLCVVLTAFLIPTTVFSVEKELSSEDLVSEVEKAGLAEGKPLDKGLLFFDQDGKKFYLKEYFNEKPLVIGYIFTKCPDVCPNIAESINRAAEKGRQELNDSFNVLLVGFDAGNDTPKNLKGFSERYAVRKGIRFIGSDASTIKALTERTGFFFRKKDGGWFDHMDMVTIVDKNGIIYRQIYGIRASEDELVRTLRELITGVAPEARPITLVEKIKYFCYKYDKASGRYVFDYSLVFGMLLEFIVIATVVITIWG
ncbi:MAG: SCO family protein, partial [Thermodesulfobacteriota bacterium]